jgi:hypothetical protein
MVTMAGVGKVPVLRWNVVRFVDEEVPPHADLGEESMAGWRVCRGKPIRIRRRFKREEAMELILEQSIECDCEDFFETDMVGKNGLRLIVCRQMLEMD